MKVLIGVHCLLGEGTVFKGYKSITPKTVCELTLQWLTSHFNVLELEENALVDLEMIPKIYRLLKLDFEVDDFYIHTQCVYYTHTQID